MELLDTTANPLKLHRQAKRLLKTTSRAKNPDWYNRARDISLQWHIWIGTQSVSSALFHKPSEKWYEGPDLPRVSFELNDAGEPDGLDENSRNALHEILRKLLGTKEFGGKPKSLGIVLHLADGLRVRDLSPDFAADSDFDSLNELLVSAPEIALGDDSISADDGNWRLLPLMGVVESEKLTIAAQVSGQYGYIVEEFRKYGELRNIPVIVEGLSAPLEGIAALPMLFEDEATFANSISLIQFEAFTILCSTGMRGEITMIRPLVHRSGNALAPADIAEVLTNSAALLNLKAPKIYYVSTTGIPEADLGELLALYLGTNEQAEYACVDATTSALVEEIPGKRIELAFLTAEPAKITADSAPLVQLGDRWAVQDFYGLSQAEAERIPTRGDLRLLKFAGIAQKVALVALFGFAGWTGMDFFTKMRSDAWKLAPTAASEMQVRLARLQKERSEWNHWNNILAKRSEGWLAMEALLSLFPDDGGVILSSASYRAQSSPGDSDDKLGIDREWKMTGYANPEIATQLSSLGSRSRVAQLLNEIAEANDAPYLKVGGESRSVDVSFQQRQGTMPPSAQFPTKVARHFRTAFDLTIKQGFDSTDELALRTEPLNTTP